MKQEAFEQAAAQMGFDLETGEGRIYIKDSNEGYLIATVCKKAMHRLNTDTEGFGFLLQIGSGSYHSRCDYRENEYCDPIRFL